MPTYDYECSKCKFRFTEIQSMKDEPKAICPECKNEAIRLISKNIGITFKGDGWATKNSAKRDDEMMKSEHPEVHKAHKEGKI